MPVVESELALFEVQEEGMLGQSTEPDQASLGIAPEAFNSVDVRWPVCEFIVAMLNTQVLAITDINQPVIPSPSIAIDNAFQGNMPANNCL